MTSVLALIACTGPGAGTGPDPDPCVATTCSALGVQCGERPDGCGGTLACGTCATGMTCGVDSGKCQKEPDPCTPTTCAALGAECGAISNGCTGTLTCGSCDGTDVCGSNHQCACVPSCSGHHCGDDGCGGSCGTCAGNDVCSTSGTCVYTASTPPAAWVCNAAYWDAHDGCDCNCGALDPDCGVSGQTLHGCTGLTSPTCNASGYCTGGGTCNATPTGPYLTLYLVASAPPAMTGGTIVPGRYEANDVTEYTGTGGAHGYTGGDGTAIEISGSTWNRVIRRAGGYPNVDETFTATVSGSTVTLARSCPSGPSMPVTFSASGTTLRIAAQSGGSTTVTTFTKKW